MRTTTIRKAAASAAFVLASAAMAQDNQIAQLQKEVSEFNGRNFIYQVLENSAGPVSKPVIGSPYSADERTVTTQTLADGNHIVNTTSAKLYRDQQGRTRVERTLKLAPDEGGSDKSVMIIDPVGGSNLVFDEGDHLITKDIPGPVTGGSHPAEMTIKHLAEAKAVGDRPGIMNYRRIENDQNVKTENLGIQIMEGLSVQGTRTTSTIPAGQMGNERAIEIVTERWFSPDLQMVVMSKRSDPRMGDTVYAVTNISRAAPDPSLFQAPANSPESPNSHRRILKRALPQDQ